MTPNGGRARPPPAAGLTIPLIELHIAGLDRTTLPEVAERIEAALHLSPRHIVIDLAGCPYIDAAAIDLLLDTHRRLWRTNGRLILRSPTRRLQNILTVQTSTRSCTSSRIERRMVTPTRRFAYTHRLTRTGLP